MKTARLPLLLSVVCVYTYYTATCNTLLVDSRLNALTTPSVFCTSGVRYNPENDRNLLQKLLQSDRIVTPQFNQQLVGSTSSLPPTHTLPVQLMSFKASMHDQHVVLDWIMATELHNTGFKLYRSVNMKDWDLLVSVPSHGNSVDPQYYTFTDEQPLYGMMYYKLEQTDLDGTTNQLDVASIAYNYSASTSYFAFPNPALDKLYLTGTAEELSSLVLTDLAGRSLIDQVQITYGEGQAQLDLSAIVEGRLLLRVGMHTAMIVHQH